MDRQAPSMLKSTLIGGATAGFVAGLPVLGALNACCCALVVAAGFFASFLYSNECKRAGAEFRPGTGAVVGLIAGLFYALSATIVGGIVFMIRGGGASIEESIEQAESMGAELPPEAEPFIDFMTNASPALLMVLFFIIWLLIAAIFSTIGGLIGGSVFKVEPAPPASPGAGTAAPPPPPPPAVP